MEAQQIAINAIQILLLSLTWMLMMLNTQHFNGHELDPLSLSLFSTSHKHIHTQTFVKHTFYYFICCTIDFFTTLTLLSLIIRHWTFSAPIKLPANKIFMPALFQCPDPERMEKAWAVYLFQIRFRLSWNLLRRRLRLSRVTLLK